ncbi:hypothetical protein N836_16635 [Leptolyngbya sp. Heron Island J]|nr:hypothetical protein N836_16635 [Leptolyngbya sp. Heron Island J]
MLIERFAGILIEGMILAVRNRQIAKATERPTPQISNRDLLFQNLRLLIKLLE